MAKVYGADETTGQFKDAFYGINTLFQREPKKYDLDKAFDAKVTLDLTTAQDLIEQIQKARDEAEKGKRVRGASTISQQTAKNVFLLPTKSYIRKGIEAYFTLLIEWIWGKERIMEVYLNSIEMGDGIYGAEAVAQAHFRKPASKLSAGEAALIAASLPNPRKFNSGKPSPYMLKRQGQILSLMGKLIKIQMGYGAGEIENKNGKIKKRKKWRASLFTTSDISIMPKL